MSAGADDGEPQGGSPATVPRPTVARLLWFSLLAGVGIFWVVAWLTVGTDDGGVASDAFLSPTAALLVWAAAALPGVGGAAWCWSRATAAADAGAATGGAGEAEADTVGQVQKWLLLTWALLEGPALLAGILFFFLGDLQLLTASAVVFLVGMLVTYPRRTLFPAPRAGSG